MKAEIHPNYFPEAKVVCACGNSFVTGSTKPEIRVEICSNCHPFYTGAAKYVDTEGRVERFQRQTEEAKTIKDVTSKKDDASKPKKETPQPKSLKEMMELLQKNS